MTKGLGYREKHLHTPKQMAQQQSPGRLLTCMLVEVQRSSCKAAPWQAEVPVSLKGVDQSRTWTNSLKRLFSPLGPIPTPVSATSKKTHFVTASSTSPESEPEVETTPVLRIHFC